MAIGRSRECEPTKISFSVGSSKGQFVDLERLTATLSVSPLVS